MPFEMLLPRWLFERERLVVFGQRRFSNSGHIRMSLRVVQGPWKNLSIL